MKINIRARSDEQKQHCYSRSVWTDALSTLIYLYYLILFYEHVCAYICVYAMLLYML